MITFKPLLYRTDKSGQDACSSDLSDDVISTDLGNSCLIKGNVKWLGVGFQEV